MDLLKAKAMDVQNEWKQTAFVFTEYVNAVLKRVGDLMSADVEYTSTLEKSHRLLLAQLSDIIKKCKSIRSMAESKSSPSAEKEILYFVDPDTLPVGFRELNTSISADFGTPDTLTKENDIVHQPRQKTFDERKISPAAEKQLFSDNPTSLTVGLCEVNPSISYDSEPPDSMYNKNLQDEAHQTRRKIIDDAPQDSRYGNSPLSADEAHQTRRKLLDFPQDSGYGRAPSPAMRTEDNYATYYELDAFAGSSTGDFGFSIGRAFSNLFSAKLNHKSILKLKMKTKLDNIQEVSVPSDAFRQETASFRPSCKGVYAINVEVCQQGKGEMDVSLCSRSHVSYVGKTRGHMMETSVLKVKMITEDQEYWVEVRALKGQPSVFWCNFSGFLIAETPVSVSDNAASP